MEKIEYRQTGMIRVKDSAISVGEISRLSSHVDIYDFIYRDSRRDWFEFINGLD